VLAVAIVLEAVALVLFLTAGDVTVLLLARVAQGVATGAVTTSLLCGWPTERVRTVSATLLAAPEQRGELFAVACTIAYLAFSLPATGLPPVPTDG